MLRVLEEKEGIISDYRKQLEQAQFLVNSKDEKYQKLKILYTDALDHRIFQEEKFCSQKKYEDCIISGNQFEDSLEFAPTFRPF